jgi:hypothetical protein
MQWMPSIVSGTHPGRDHERRNRLMMRDVVVTEFDWSINHRPQLERPCVLSAVATTELSSPTALIFTTVTILKKTL